MSEIKTSGRNVEVSDISSKNSFRVSFPFDRVFSSSNDIINQYRDDFPLRIVSVCSSDLLFEQISSSFQSIVEIYFEKLEESERFISFGEVHNDKIHDLLSNSIDTFEMVRFNRISEAIDLIFTFVDDKFNFGNEIFVFRIGKSKFVEWIIVPKVEQYIDSLSNFQYETSTENLIFFLKTISTNQKRLKTFFDGSISTNPSNAFSLLIDSFYDINTIWIGHLSSKSKLITNSIIFDILRYVRNIHVLPFLYQRSKVFDIGEIHWDNYETISTQTHNAESFGNTPVEYDSIQDDISLKYYPDYLELDNFEEEDSNKKNDLNNSSNIELLEKKIPIENTLLEIQMNQIRKSTDSFKLNKSKSNPSSPPNKISEEKIIEDEIARKEKIDQIVQQMIQDKKSEKDMDKTESRQDHQNMSKTKDTKLTSTQIRQKKYQEQKLLVFRCIEASKPGSKLSIDELVSLKKQLDESLQDSIDFKNSITSRMLQLRKEIQDSQAEVENSSQKYKSAMQEYYAIKNKKMFENKEYIKPKRSVVLPVESPLKVETSPKSEKKILRKRISNGKEDVVNSRIQNLEREILLLRMSNKL